MDRVAWHQAWSAEPYGGMIVYDDDEDISESKKDTRGQLKGLPVIESMTDIDIVMGQLVAIISQAGSGYQLCQLIIWGYMDVLHDNMGTNGVDLHEAEDPDAHARVYTIENARLYTLVAGKLSNGLLATFLVHAAPRDGFGLVEAIKKRAVDSSAVTKQADIDAFNRMRQHDKESVTDWLQRAEKQRVHLMVVHQHRIEDDIIKAHVHHYLNEKYRTARPAVQTAVSDPEISFSMYGDRLINSARMVDADLRADAARDAESLPVAANAAAADDASSNELARLRHENAELKRDDELARLRREIAELKRDARICELQDEIDTLRAEESVTDTEESTDVATEETVEAIAAFTF